MAYNRLTTTNTLAVSKGKTIIDGHRVKTGNEFVTPILPIELV